MGWLKEKSIKFFSTPEVNTNEDFGALGTITV